MKTRINNILGMLALLATGAFGHDRIFGYCQDGNKTVTTNTVISTTLVQQSYPSCTVTVYYAGTLTLATLYQDNLGTVLSNPFTASNTGYWYFYQTGKFDVNLSNGGIPTPFTLGDIQALPVTFVNDYGAKCDGTADDTAAIQTAITQTAARQTVLNLPPGVCLISHLTLPNNLVLQGQGSGLSTLKQAPLSATSNTPILINSNTSSGNTNITLSGFTLDGNSINQNPVSEVTGFKPLTVTNLTISNVEFINIIGWPIRGANWTNVRITGNRFSNYALNSATGKNTACVGLSEDQATAPSNNITVDHNFCDGTLGVGGGIKLSGSPTNLIKAVNITDNTLIVGDSGNTDSTLGIELWGPGPGINYRDFVISHNIIRGVSSSSPFTNITFGISVCGAGGSNGVVNNNSIKWIGGYSIEICGPDISVIGNTLDTTAQIIINNSAFSSFVLNNVSLVGNIIENPTGYAPVGQGAIAIHVYTQNGGFIDQLTITGNNIHYTNPTPPSPSNHAIHLQCNSSSGSITNVIIANNTLIGPGSSTTVDGILLEQDGTCPVDKTQLLGNIINNFGNAISYNGTTNTQTINNTYANNGVIYAGGPGISDLFSDVTKSTDYTKFLANLNFNYNLILTHSGQYFQTNNGASTPNIVTWNSGNGGNCSIGGIISTNTRQNLSSDPVPNGWTQTSSGAFNRALYTQLGACEFRVSFGPATGAGPNPPSDNIVFVAEDTNSNSGGIVAGGVGIGHKGITQGMRLREMYTASNSWTPGTIANGGYATLNIGIPSCMLGDMIIAGFTGVTQTGVSVQGATLSNNSANITIFNNSGGSLTYGSGTATMICFSLNN